MVRSIMAKGMSSIAPSRASKAHFKNNGVFMNLSLPGLGVVPWV
jgi:hypothetical protein